VSLVGEAFLWGLLAASSLVFGAAVAAVRPPRRGALGLVLGFGAGVLLCAVSFELVEEAVETSGGSGGTTLGFFTGALVFLAGDWAIGRLGAGGRAAAPGAGPSISGLAILLGTVLDGIPESAVLGLTLVESGTVSAAMLIAVFVSNVPEAIAATVSLRGGGWPLGRLFALWSLTAVGSGAAAALGYGLLAGASGWLLSFVLAFAGGAILAMLSTTMMPEAYEHAGRLVGLATTSGFALAYGINWLAG
jgi:ZIP family zinc transporter